MTAEMVYPADESGDGVPRAKIDMGLRPVFRQKPDSEEAHLLVCFLALAPWRRLG